MFFQRAGDDKFVHLDIAALPDPKGAIGCLIFHGRIPPAVEMEDMVGAGEIEASTTGAQTQDKDGGILGILKIHHHALALVSRRAPMEE